MIQTNNTSIHPEYQYLNILNDILENGSWKKNRTGIQTKFIAGAMMKFDLSKHFPLITTKKMATKACIGELCAFLRASTSAKTFRELGCNFWDDNANKNEEWLLNPNRTGVDDLGHVYGYIWNNWDYLEIVDKSEIKKVESHPPKDNRFIYNTQKSLTFHNVSVAQHSINQLLTAINNIYYKPQDRRIIITAWKIDEFNIMALPPCHVSYEFIVDTEQNKLHLTMWQRSCDMFLGVPMNVASASLFLHMMARITGLNVGTFTHFLSDAHIYENHVDQVHEQLKRIPKDFCQLNFTADAPKLGASFEPEKIYLFEPSHIQFENYESHPAIKAPMAI